MARKFYKYDPDTKSIVTEEAEAGPTINVPWMDEPTTYSEIDIPNINLPKFSKNKINGWHGSLIMMLDGERGVYI